MTMGLHAQFSLRRGDFQLDAGVEVADGETLALLGPNGAGKSTMLNTIAGLLSPGNGSVTVNDTVLTRSVPGQPRFTLAAHRRRIGLLGQDPLLFPHLSALENVAFGARSQGADAASARRRAREWLDAVGLADCERRRPAALSGGQQQRVAIARALAAEPEVLLLDEPMAALDVETASLIRTLLRERLTAGSVTTVLVTHDVVDALVLADRVAILEAGRIVDIGPTARVLAQPINRFAAALVGVNLLSGTVASGLVQLGGGRELMAEVLREPDGAAVSLTFPPSAVQIRPLATTAVPCHGVNSWPAIITALEPGVGGIRVVLDAGATTAQVQPSDVIAAGLTQGSRVCASVPPSAVTVYRAPR